MKKKSLLFSLCLLLAFLLSSCCSWNTVTHISQNSTLGTRQGEAVSFLIMGTFGANGPHATLKDACRNGNIVTIHHIETTTKSYFFGFIIRKVIRVYGDGPEVITDGYSGSQFKTSVTTPKPKKQEVKKEKKPKKQKAKKVKTKKNKNVVENYY